MLSMIKAGVLLITWTMLNLSEFLASSVFAGGREGGREGEREVGMERGCEGEREKEREGEKERGGNHSIKVAALTKDSFKDSVKQA